MNGDAEKTDPVVAAFNLVTNSAKVVFGRTPTRSELEKLEIGIRLLAENYPGEDRKFCETELSGRRTGHSPMLGE